MITQKIILSSSINGSEMLKTLARFNENTLGVSYMNTLQLAEYLLEKAGIFYTKNFIKNEPLAVFIYNDVKDIEHFKHSSLIDIIEVVNSINDLRRCIVSNEKEEIGKLIGGEFPAKNEAMVEVYHLMMDYLNENDLIDEVGIIRFAHDNISAFDDIEFEVYEKSLVLEYALDIALLEKAAGKKVIPTKISSNEPLKIKSYTKAFGQVNEVEHILSYIFKNNIPLDDCLIASAEMDGYVNNFTNYSDLLKFPLAVCDGVPLMNTNPGKLFQLVLKWNDRAHDVKGLFDIVNDVSFDVDLLKQDLGIPDSFEKENEELDYLHQISFESIIKTCGELRLDFNVEENVKKLDAYINLLVDHYRSGYEKMDTARRVYEKDYVIKFAEILHNGMHHLIARYSNIYNSQNGKNALGKILLGLDYFVTISSSEKCKNKEDILLEIIKLLENSNLSIRENSEGCLFLTNINKAPQSLRKHLFIVGLSSNNFPGSSKENPYLLDSDYSLCGVINASQRSINRNKNAYNFLLDFANKYGCEIHLSYAYYNSQTLKDQNASSVIFDTFKKEYGETKTLEDLKNSFEKNKDKFITVEYFENNLLSSSDITKAFKEGILLKTIKEKEEELRMLEEEELYESEFESLLNVEDKQEDQAGLLYNTVPIPLEFINKGKGLSASQIITFTECPYKFYLSKLLKINSEDMDDPFCVVKPNEMGTLVHLVFEYYDKKTCKTEADFLKMAEKTFDDYMIFHPNPNVVLVEKARQEFLEMMVNGYNMIEDDEESFTREQDISVIHSSGIKIHGLPDNVAVLSNGAYYVIDYKTNGKLKHIPSKPRTMLQCAVYSYILNKKYGVNVSGFEYRYLKLNSKVSSNDQKHGHDIQEYLDELDGVLKEIKECCESGEFPSAPKNCTFCYFASRCPKRK